MDAPRPPVRLGRELFIRGEIEGEGDLIVDGRLEGRIRIARGVAIEAGAEVAADIEAARVRIAGRSNGNITAKESIAIEAGAEVAGVLRAPSIAVADGAAIRARIEMAVDLPPGLEG